MLMLLPWLEWFGMPSRAAGDREWCNDAKKLSGSAEKTKRRRDVRCGRRSSKGQPARRQGGPVGVTETPHHCPYPKGLACERIPVLVELVIAAPSRVCGHRPRLRSTRA